MKKYKLLKQEGYPKFIKGMCYNANFRRDESCFSVEELVKKYPKDWELVEDKFVLPEKWCVNGVDPNINAEDSELLRNYFKGKTSTKWNITTLACFYFIQENNTIRRYNQPEDYTLLTFEQFKKYVLNMKEEKEIIGYRLVKEEFLPALKMIDTYWEPNLHKHKGYNLQYECGAYNKFKEAGVLDLWFEPVFFSENS